MRPTPARPALYALLVCLPVGLSAFAVGGGLPGGESEPASQTIQPQQRSDTAERDRRDTASRNAPLKGREMPARALYKSSAAALHDGGRIAPHSRSPLPAAHAYVSKPAVASVAREYPARSADADRAAGRSDRATPVGRASSAASAPAVASRSVAILKAVAGNGIIGGPHASGGGTIGGPANGRTVIKASIDGSALRRRS